MFVWSFWFVGYYTEVRFSVELYLLYCFIPIFWSFSVRLVLHFQIYVNCWLCKMASFDVPGGDLLPLSEEDIHDAFIARHSCTALADRHFQLLNPTHIDYMPHYALLFRKFRFSCKSLPDYQDAMSRLLLHNQMHCEMMDYRHPNFDPVYNYEFHCDQDRKGLRSPRRHK